MAEAVAGLSLAANILQMVEYGGVFVTTAWKIYSTNTDTDVVKDFKQLQYLAGDVNRVLGTLQQENIAFPSTSMSPQNGDPDLARLAEECCKVTKEILDFVGKTGDERSWKTRMHKAVKEAFRLTWDQDKLIKLQSKLDGMRSQLILRLVHSLRNYAAASSETQEMALSKITESMKHLDFKIDEALGLGLGTVSVDFIAQKVAGDQSGHLRESLKSEILRAISETGQAAGRVEPSLFKIASSRRQTLKEKLLANLSYPDMPVREASVVEASETTFRWIFEREKRPDRPWASFCEWLEAPDKQLYWITGKPGSGKSTLMKFISQPANDEPTNELGNPSNEPRCSPSLSTWAGSHPLIIASYYFWAIGSPMQKSKEGMLRTLLHKLLSQAAPEVMAAIMPESWEALHLFDENPQSYTESSLQILLSRAFHYMCPSMKICLFIDGLDEFEGHHEDLVSYLSAALKIHPIKLCVSSRQWQVFEDAFHSEPSLRLQDLTLPDMMGYVRSELYAEPGFALLRNLDASFSGKLDERIALRANGVFLWLKLVVVSVRKGIRAGDRISDLHLRLDRLPQDLEALFERILGELDTEYLDHTIQYFELMEASRKGKPLNAMVFSYADEEDEMFGINCPVSPLDMKTYENRRDQLKRRLNSRCMGLLEITEQPPSGESVFIDAALSRVNYLHRTVGDYIARDEIHERLSERAGRGLHQSYDPHLRLCSSELAFYKSSPSALLSGNKKPESIRSRGDYIIQSSVVNCLRHAAQVQKPGFQSMARLVDALENLLPVDSYHDFVLDVSANLHFTWGPRTMKKLVSDRPPLICLAIQFGVVEYIRAKTHGRSQTPKLWHKLPSPVRKLRRSSLSTEDAWSDLDWQLAVAVLSKFPSPPTVELLLERGADPKYVDRNRGLSSWELALGAYMFECLGKRQEREGSHQIVALMIKYGVPIERKIIRQVYQFVTKQDRIETRKETFCSEVEKKLKIMKQGFK